ncbi:hypothetical protein GCM10022237_39460 [Nocardioides ginsengisoli]|uniref:MafI family immunity protein n=1 Tax=Kribbella ginsengisoli TaxID=363865 RepID=A0ABP6Z8L0_9ACTN
MKPLTIGGQPVDLTEALARFRQVWGDGSDGILLHQLANEFEPVDLSCSEINALADLLTAIGDHGSAATLLEVHVTNRSEDAYDLRTGGHREDPRLSDRWEEITKERSHEMP